MVGRILLCGAVAAVVFAQDADEKFSCGTMSFRDGPYMEAIAAAERYVAAHPNDLNGHVCLGVGYMTHWVPGASSPENDDVVGRAREHFGAALALDPNEVVSIYTLAM